MKEKLLKIINHYGVNNQQRKLAEEIFELQESITIHELKNSVSYEIPLTELIDTEKHIVEELADAWVLLKQIQYYYNIGTKDIKDVMIRKIDRTISRMDSKSND